MRSPSGPVYGGDLCTGDGTFVKLSETLAWWDRLGKVAETTSTVPSPLG
jgi:hypothetical protein